MLNRLRDIVENIRFFRRTIALLGIDYFQIRFRAFHERPSYSSLRRLLRTVALLAIAGYAAFLVGKFLYGRPGSGFGPHGEGYLRFSLAASAAEIDEALARLRRALS